MVTLLKDKVYKPAVGHRDLCPIGMRPEHVTASDVIWVDLTHLLNSNIISPYI